MWEKFVILPENGAWVLKTLLEEWMLYVNADIYSTQINSNFLPQYLFKKTDIKKI